MEVLDIPTFSMIDEFNIDSLIEIRNQARKNYIAINDAVTDEPFNDYWLNLWESLNSIIDLYNQKEVITEAVDHVTPIWDETEGDWVPDSCRKMVDIISGQYRANNQLVYTLLEYVGVLPDFDSDEYLTPLQKGRDISVTAIRVSHSSQEH